MRHVFLVTSGEYSDYRVDAAYSTRRKAEAHLKNYPRPPLGDDVRIEPYPLDAKRAHRRCRVCGNS